MNNATGILVALRMQFAFDRDVILGIGQCAHTFGNIVLHPKEFAEHTIWQAAEAGKVDGVILSASTPEEVNELWEKGIPCVNVANYLEAHDRVPVVGNDDLAVSKLVADYYLENGFRHFAFFGELGNQYFLPRQENFCRFVREAGYECFVGPPPYTEDDRKRQNIDEHHADWLASLPKPLAIMCPYDVYAVQAMRALHVLQERPGSRIKIPEEVSIIGVDNDPTFCLTVYPQISSVATSGFKIGFKALELLIDLINGKPKPASPILLPPSEIVLRGSSCDMAIPDQDVAAAVNYIKANLGQPFTIETMVDALAVSRRTLERKFLEILGRTPLEELRRVRIGHAKRLLIETDLGYPEIARRSGLIWHQRLSNLIKEESGMTPAKFREKYGRDR